MSGLLLLVLCLTSAQNVVAGTKLQPLKKSDQDFVQRLSSSSEFLKQLECVWNHVPELRKQTYDEVYDRTIWELKEITENIPFQAFLSRYNILQSVKAAGMSQSAINALLASEYAALSKIKARLTGILEKLRTKYNLKIFHYDTLQRELDHINNVREQIQSLEEAKRSRLTSIVLLQNKIRSSERLISRQKELLSDYGDAISLPVLLSPNFQPHFRPFTCGSRQSSIDLDEVSA